MKLAALGAVLSTFGAVVCVRTVSHRARMDGSLPQAQLLLAMMLGVTFLIVGLGAIAAAILA